MSDHVTIRLRFHKTGAIRYIGHLDVMRFFQKCLRRAQIPVAYTGGFSPHQILTFAAPLSVGHESYGEYVDVELETLTSNTAELIQRLNEASVPEIKIVSAKLLPKDVGNAMASVAAASYQVQFQEDRTPMLFQAEPAVLQGAVDAFLSKESIPYVKEGKKGKRDVDLRPGIFSMSWDEKERSLFLMVDASSKDTVKPIQVIEAFLSDHGETLQERALRITRLDTFTETTAAEDSERVFVSLDEVGKNF